MKLLGKGMFTKAYLQDDNTVLLKSDDPIKECMSLGWFPDSPLFPKVIRVGHDKYVMDYYPKVRSLKNNLDPEEWKIYQTLRDLPIQYGLNQSNYSMCYKAFERIPEDLVDSEGNLVRDVMLEALDNCTNYGDDVTFDLAPRNVAVNNGKLVLLDVFCMGNLVRAKRSS